VKTKRVRNNNIGKSYVIKFNRRRDRIQSGGIFISAVELSEHGIELFNKDRFFSSLLYNGIEHRVTAMSAQGIIIEVIKENK
jgi:hypothetical protein